MLRKQGVGSPNGQGNPYHSKFRLSLAGNLQGYAALAAQQTTGQTTGAITLQLTTAVLFLLGITGLLLPRVLFAQTVAQNPNVITSATFVSEEVPSSILNSFSLTLLQDDPAMEDFGFTFRDCVVNGTPADNAINVGVCRWTEFVDNGFDLLFFRFNWNDAENPDANAIFGQFCLVNDLGFGNWVRFFTPDGTEEGVVGSASGQVTYDEVPAGVNPNLCTTEVGVASDAFGTTAAFRVTNHCADAGNIVNILVENSSGNFEASDTNLVFAQGGMQFRSTSDFTWLDSLGNIVRDRQVPPGTILDTLVINLRTGTPTPAATTLNLRTGTPTPATTLNFNAPFNVLYLNGEVVEFPR